jgi:hypothetical protein
MSEQLEQGIKQAAKELALWMGANARGTEAAVRAEVEKLLRRNLTRKTAEQGGGK